jgi:hypothetical protein
MLYVNKLFAALLLLTFCTAVGCKPTQKNNMTENNQKPQAGKNGWVAIFNGENTNGWHNYNKTTIGPAWKVKDGALYLDVSNKEDWQTKGGGDIVFEKEYENFHLSLEWKVAPGGNSGIMFYVQETNEFRYPWNTGPEMQVLDNERHADAKIHKHRAGDLYDLIASSSEPVKPAGEWNHAEIISKNSQLTFKLNGVTVVQTTLWDEAWKQLIAGSKFKSMKGFGTFKKGKLALQDHGDEVWFKNVLVKEL